MPQSIRETDNYKLIVGTSVESGNPCYQVVHKNYGVVEIETYILPQAYQYIKDLEGELSGRTQASIVPKSTPRLM
jgi:hypothetical protein